MAHPVSLLLAWIGYAVALQWAPHVLALVLSLICLALAAVFSLGRMCNLIGRSRWLLLSIGILFVFFTSGEYLPGLLGDLRVTREGLALAGEHLWRLVALLGGLSLLLERLGTNGLLDGLHCLLRPFSWGEATVVRLMLILQHVERPGRNGWRDWLQPVADENEEDERMKLATTPLRFGDKVVIGGMLVAASALVIWT